MPKPKGGSQRRTSRRIALDVLYEHEISGMGADEILKRYSSSPAFTFATELVRGVTDNLEEIDALITKYSKDWTMDRMPVVDRSLLRIGVFEMLHLDDVPVAVTIDEAVELAKTFSTEDSGRFVNGLLSRIAKET